MNNEKKRVRLREYSAIKRQRAYYRWFYSTANMSDQRRSSRRKRMRAYNKRPEIQARAKVYSAVRYALKRGILKKKPCVKCGSTNSQAHHSNYNKPLDVQWLCPQCHAIKHKRSPRYRNPKFLEARRAA